MEDGTDNVASKGDEDTGLLSSVIIDDLISRAKTILTELELFRERLRTLRLEGSVEAAHFKNTVKSELGMLERLSSQTENESTRHVARSSNLPFLETVWATAKSSESVNALLKRIYVDLDPKAEAQDMRHSGLTDRRRDRKKGSVKSIIIDAITDDGLTWTKISLVTNTRLLFDLAKQGWEVGDSEDDDDPPDHHDDDDEQDVPLLKTAKELTRAAKCFRIRTKRPSVRLILPRMRPGTTSEIDDILDECRRCGAEIICADDITLAPKIEDAMSSMAPDPIEHFSEILNVDCTILLALVSEFSHAKVTKEPWFHTALQRQVEIEDNENLLPSLLYPALGAHKLVCTREAADRMREIVDTIGTPSEKARTAIMMGDDVSKTQSELVHEMQQWSAYSVPSDWQLPISVVDSNENDCLTSLSEEAKTVSASMTAINHSVFMYGWATGRTTVTSNRSVVKQIESDLEKFENLDDSIWPKMWLCPTARSLVGKEKRGEKKDAHKSDTQRLPDPLRREHQRRNGLDILSIREGRKVEDLRPNGYPCEDVIAAKMASHR